LSNRSVRGPERQKCFLSWTYSISLLYFSMVSKQFHWLINLICLYFKKSKVQCSRHSDWLRAGRPRGRSSSLGRCKIFLLSTSPRPVLGPTQTPIQSVLGALSPEVKRPGPLTSSKCRGQEYVDLYSHSPIRLHGVVLN
jgi:hypothetical protein